MDGPGSDPEMDSGTEQFAWENGAFLIQLVCLASALVMGLVMKHHRVHYIPEAGATSGSECGEARGGRYRAERRAEDSSRGS